MASSLLPPPTRRVLVVDDYEDAATSLAVLLNLWGYEARVVLGGRDALMVADEYQPDIAIVETYLHGVDGYEVGCQLLGRGIEVVVVSGQGDAKHRRRCQDGGFVNVLLKPVDPEELEAVLRTLAGV